MSTEIVPNVEGGYDKARIVDLVAMTDDYYAQTQVRAGMLERRYESRSDKKVADGAWVPIDSFVPDGTQYGPDDPGLGSLTRLLDDKNIFGLDSVAGDRHNCVPISRYLTEEDCEMLVEQKIQNKTLEEDMNFLKARLELDEKLAPILGYISLDEYETIANSPDFISPSA